MIRKGILFLFVVGLTLSSAAWAADEISYSGSSTIGTGVLNAGAAEAFTEETGIRFSSIDQPGSSKGIAALLEGKVSLAGVSRPLKPAEKETSMVPFIIGYDAIAIFVHKNNPVTNISQLQLKGIFTGKTKNWSKVGGQNASIEPTTEILADKRATNQMFKKIAMNGEKYGAGFKEFDRQKDQLIDLSGRENGICTVSMGLLSSASEDVRNQIKMISVEGVAPSAANVQAGTYLISRPLLLITNGPATGGNKQFIKFMLSYVGQAFVGQNFVGVRGH